MTYLYLSILMLFNFQTNMLVLSKPIENYLITKIPLAVTTSRTTGAKRIFQNLQTTASAASAAAMKSASATFSSPNQMPSSSPSTNTFTSTASSNFEASRDDRQSKPKSDSGSHSTASSTTLVNSNAIIFPTRRTITSSTTSRTFPTSASVNVYWNAPQTSTTTSISSSTFMVIGASSSTTMSPISGSSANQNRTSEPAKIDFKEIINAPEFKCRDDEKKDENGKCRIVYYSDSQSETRGGF